MDSNLRVHTSSQTSTTPSSWPPHSYDPSSASSSSSASSRNMNNSRSRSRSHSRSRSRSRVRAAASRSTTTTSNNIFKAVRKPSASTSDILPFAMSPTTPSLSSSSEDRSRFSSRPLFPDDDDDDAHGLDEDEEDDTDLGDYHDDEDEEDEEEDDGKSSASAKQPVNENVPTSSNSSTSSPSIHSLRKRTRRRRQPQSQQQQLQTRKHRTSSYSISPHSPLGVLLAPLSTSQDSSAGPSSYATTASSSSSPPSTCDTTATSPESTSHHSHGGSRNKAGGDVGTLFSLSSFPYNESHRHHQKRDSVDSTGSRSQRSGGGATTNRGAAHPSRTHHSRGSTRSNSMSTSRSECCSECGHQDGEGIMVRNLSADGSRGGGGSGAIHSRSSASSSEASSQVSAESSPLFPPLRPSSSSITTASLSNWNASSGGGAGLSRGQQQQPSSPLSTPRMSSNTSLPSVAHQSTTSVATSTTNTVGTSIFSIPPPKSIRTLSGLSAGSSLTSNSSSTTDSSSAVSSKSGGSSSTGSSVSGSGSGSHVPPIPSPLRFLQGKQGGVGVGVGPPRLPSMGASFVSLTSSKPAEIIVHAAGGGGVPGVPGGTSGTGRSTSDTFGSAFSASARLLRSPTLYQSASSGDLMNAAAGGAGGQSQGMQRSSSASTASAATTPGKSPPNGMGGANLVEGAVPTSPNYETDSPNTSAFSFSSASTITAANANAGIGSAAVDAGYTTAETSTSASARARGRSPSHILRRTVFSPSREPSCGLGLGPLADDDDEGESAETDRPIGGSRKDERKFRTEPVNARHNGRRRSSIRAMGELMGFTTSSSVDGGAAEGRDDGEGEEDEDDDDDEEEEEEEDGRGRRSRRDDGIDRESYAARIYNIQQQMGGRLWSRFNLGGGGSSSSSPTPTPSASTITAAGGTRTPDATGSSSYGHGRPSYGSSTTRAASPKRSLASLLPSAALSTMPAPRLSRTSTGSSSGGSSLLSGKSGSQSFESDLNANGEGGGGSRQRSSPTSRSQKTVGGGEGVDLHAQQRRNSHSSRLTNGLRSLVKLPNLLLGAVSVGAGEKDSSSSGASSGGGSTQQYVGSTTSPHRLGSSDGASSSLLAPSTTGSSGGGEPQRLSSSRSRKSFAESTRRMSSSSSSRASLNSGWGGRGVVSPLEGDSDPGAYVFGLGLPIDPDTELGSVVQLQTFRTGHGYPFNRSRTLSLDTGAAAAHREALARSSLDAEDGGSGPMDISGRGAAGSNITTASSSSSSSMREPPNVVHRGSVPEGKEVAELLAARKQGRDSLLSGIGSGSGSSASTRGKSPSSSASSSDSLAGVAAVAPPPASDAGSATSNASGGGAFWARPSRPAAEAVPQNYSAFRSRQRAGIKKVKDPVSPGPSSGAGAGGLVSTLSSATNSSASLSTGTGSGSGSGGQSVRSGGSSELSADSSSLSSHDDDRTGPSSAEVGDSSRMGRLRIPYSASTVGASGSGAGVADGGQSRSRDPSPPSQHAVGLYTGGGFCSPRRLSADEGLPPLSASGVRRTKSGSNYTRRTSVESRRARASHPTPEMHSDGGEEPAQFPPVVDESGEDDGEMDSRGAVSGRGRPKTNRSPTDSASSSLRGRGNGVKVVSASQGSSARSPSSNGNGSGSNNDAGQQGRNRSRLLSADIWKAAGSIAKPRPPQSAPSPSRKRASPSRKAKAIAPAGRLSSPPGFRPRMAPRPLPIGGPPPVMPRSSGPGGSGSRAMHAAAAAAASNGGVNSGSRPGGPQMSGSPGPGARLSLMSNNKHLLMLSLELEMMRKRKISAPLKPRAFVVRWIRQQAQQEGDEDEEGYDDEDEGEEEEEEDGAMGGLALERSNSSPPRMENQSSGRRTAHGGGHGHGHGHGNAIPAASDGMKTPEMRARIFLAGGSSLRYEVRPDASSGGGGGVSVS